MAYRRTPRIQARLDEQRRAILDAAADLLAARGYRACSMAAVSGAAGISVGSVYTHFASKAELVAEVFRDLVGREVTAVQAAAADHQCALAQLSAVVETFAGRALRSPRRAHALLAEPVDPAVDALRLEFRRRFATVFADAIALGVATGELPPQPPELSAAALVGAIAEALVAPLGEPRVDAAVHADTVPALIGFVHRAVAGAVAGAAHAHA